LISTLSDRCRSFVQHVLHVIRYGDGAGNTVEEDCSIFSLIQMH